jgi:hypothetical protein
MKIATEQVKENIKHDMKQKNTDLAVEKWTKLVTEVSLQHFRASDSEIRSAYSLALDDDTELHALNRELKEEKKYTIQTVITMVQI